MSIRIKAMTIHQLQMTLKHPFTTSFGTFKEKDFFIIEAIGEDETRGYGESVAFSIPWYTEETLQTNWHIMTDFLIPLLKTFELAHPDEVTEVLQPIKGNRMAKAAIEGAIWDLYAKQQNKSLANVFGGTKKTIEVGISIGLERTIVDLFEKIQQALDKGFKRIKLKIEPGNDITLLEQVRNKFPNVPLMADANSAYTLADIDHLRKLDEFNLMMIEQPLAYDDIVDHATLQRAIKTPICLDESIYSVHDVRKAVELGSCKIINVKIGRVGGLTEAKRIHDYCAENNIDVWCGGMLEAGVGRAHNIALTSLAQFTLPGDTAGSSHYWERDIISPEVIVKDGTITVPTGKGIGYDIDWDALSTYRVKETTFQF